MLLWCCFPLLQGIISNFSLAHFHFSDVLCSTYSLEHTLSPMFRPWPSAEILNLNVGFAQTLDICQFSKNVFQNIEHFSDFSPPLMGLNVSMPFCSCIHCSAFTQLSSVACCRLTDDTPLKQFLHPYHHIMAAYQHSFGVQVSITQMSLPLLTAQSWCNLSL